MLMEEEYSFIFNVIRFKFRYLDNFLIVRVLPVPVGPFIFISVGKLLLFNKNFLVLLVIISIFLSSLIMLSFKYLFKSCM